MTGAWRIVHRYRGESATMPVDRAISTLAEGQHGVVSRAQLGELDVERGAIDRRIRTGRLHPVHRGVYAVGHGLLSLHGRWMAAVLACGPGAALNHRDAAQLWGRERSRVPPSMSR